MVTKVLHFVTELLLFITNMLNILRF